MKLSEIWTGRALPALAAAAVPLAMLMAPGPAGAAEDIKIGVIYD